MGRPEPLDAQTAHRMQAVKRRDTRPELALRRELHKRGLRYYVDREPLPGLRRRADIVFPRLRVAVFVDGCFWHCCPIHGTTPRNNAEFWTAKLAANVVRDRETDLRLAEAGWRVVRIWEHQPTREAIALVLTAVAGERAIEPRDAAVRPPS